MAGLLEKIWPKTAKIRKWLLYAWFLLLGYSALGIIGALTDRFPLFFTVIDLCCIATGLLYLLNQDNFTRDKEGSALMLLAFTSVVAGFLCLVAGYDRQRAYFDKYFLSRKVRTEDVTDMDEDGEHSKKTYNLDSDQVKAREVFDVIYMVIVFGTPFLLGSSVTRNFSKITRTL